MKVLKFETQTCGPCRMLSAILCLPEFDDINLEVVDIETATGRAKAIEYGIRMVPSLVKILDDGQLHLLNGLPSPGELRNWLGTKPSNTDLDDGAEIEQPNDDEDY